jgi:NAD(P)H-nitrite reductase large subunit
VTDSITLSKIKKIMNEDIEICLCNGIMRSEIVKAIKEKGLKTADEVGEATTAGTVCGGCIPDIEVILKEING